MRANHRQKGQAIIMAVICLGLFMIGAMGLAIDTGTLYFHRNMAQAAADASAVAAMMSVFQGKNKTTDTGYFPTSGTFTCTSHPAAIPCVYAGYHGFGGTGDTIEVSFPAPSVSIVVSQVQVLIKRQVPTSFIRLVGASALAEISAVAVAATTSVNQAIPIIVLHPKLDASLNMNGTLTLTIEGGPVRSIQVNSESSSAYNPVGGSTINLTKAGPNNQGGDFGVFGPVPNPGNILFGTRPGVYIQPSSPMADPFIGVAFAGPPQPANDGTITPITVDGTYGCDMSAIGSNGKPCHLYTPGYYDAGISVGPNDMALFTPGLYYMGKGRGFSTKSNGVMAMCNGCPGSPAGADFGYGMLVYNKYTGSQAPTFDISGGGNVSLIGTPPTSVWNGLLFYQDHTAPAVTHNIGGTGCLQLQGTIYTTNTTNTILASPGFGQFQTILLHGNPCSTTAITGQIITDVLDIRGNSDLKMLLSTDSAWMSRQVALIK